MNIVMKKDSVPASEEQKMLKHLMSVYVYDEILIDFGE